MLIAPEHIERAGPGVAVSESTAGLSIRMADPVRDFAQGRNAVTLTYDLLPWQNVRLHFEAKELGDEPHAPPSNPFTGDLPFDGVALSADGITWHEIQDLRHLRSDRFTAFDLDLDTVILRHGLAYGPAFRVRFGQVDDNPAPMDGIVLHAIRLTGEAWTPSDPTLWIHLPMDDNAPTPLVRDLARRHHQVLLDPGGDARTSAHSVAGPVGAALQFDGVDDRIDLGPGFAVEILGEGHDFTVALWVRNPLAVNETTYVLSKHSVEIKFVPSSGGQTQMQLFNGTVNRVAVLFGTLDGGFHHYAIVRGGTTIEHWYDGVRKYTSTDVGNDGSFANPTETMRLGMRYNGWGPYRGVLADFRLYGRALPEEEILALFRHGE
jgi:hypothetical protein